MLKTIPILSLLLLVFSQYDKNMAFQCAKLSAMAYSSKQQIQTVNCYYCPKHIESPIFFSNAESDLQGFVAYSNLLKKIVVSIRGSINLKNHAENMLFNKAVYEGIQCPKCTVHHGFGLRAALLSNSVVSAISSIMRLYGIVEIMMTGHSLGGALSTIIGLQLIRKQRYTVSIYTFGSPRVGNQLFAQLCSKSFKSSYRVVNQRDTIAHLVPKNFNYCHIDTQIWYTAPNKYYECEGDKVDKCANSVYLIMTKAEFHKMDNYIALYTTRGAHMRLRSALRSSGDNQGEKRERMQGIEGFQLYRILSRHQNESEIPQLAN